MWANPGTTSSPWGTDDATRRHECRGCHCGLPLRPTRSGRCALRAFRQRCRPRAGGGLVRSFTSHSPPRDEVVVAEEITNVWYRRPKPLSFDLGMVGAERSHTLSEWAEALEGYFAHIPFEAWMNHPSSNACASHKIEQLTRASRHGLLVPRPSCRRMPPR